MQYFNYSMWGAIRLFFRILPNVVLSNSIKQNGKLGDIAQPYYLSASRYNDNASDV